MKIQILSDLHREFGCNEIKFDQADLVIFAGDVNLGIKGIQWIHSEIKTTVVYVLGNHEYYKGSYPKTLNKIKDLAKNTHVHVLENNSVELDGIIFHGATLWTDFELFGNPRYTGSLVQGKMNDYKLIRRDPSYSKLRTIDTYQIHKASLKWLEQSLATSSSKKNIVIIHHAPSIRSIPERLRENIVSSAYASNLESIILQYQPEYWIHGHIHEPSFYKIGGTQIICNPHEYIDDAYNGFDPALFIEV
ncbi:MAG: metallophosphoesterase [Sporocytophaga sp.]|uniref:metallophosphoesterase n=1 Tax=Sporocytophaga sp. TaxID=2231183 RepID=UPI001B0C7C6B|nr:metallophosphoesterase [Sporocytophaga sp.]MBO9702207.1 metallophosphoesterase [Sporocytophaga sp.]